MHSRHITILSAALSAALLLMCETQNFAQAPKPSNDASPSVRIDAPVVAMQLPGVAWGRRISYLDSHPTGLQFGPAIAHYYVYG